MSMNFSARRNLTIFGALECINFKYVLNELVLNFTTSYSICIFLNIKKITGVAKIINNNGTDLEKEQRIAVE